MNIYKILSREKAPIEIQEKEISKAMEEYPFADISCDGVSVRIWDRDYTCMKCGTKLTNVTDKKLIKGEWIPRKSKNNFHQAVCMKCSPTTITILGEVRYIL